MARPIRDRIASRLGSLGRFRAHGASQEQPHAKEGAAALEATEVEARRHPHGVLELRLKGQAKRNALGRAAIERLESFVSVPPLGTRVIVITAEGSDFCAGYDLHEAARGDAEQLIAHSTNFASFRSSRVPIIAALHGRVIGGGLELALAADVRLASPDTALSIPAGRLGLVYSEAGIRLLVDEVGESWARAMLLAGRVVTAEEAKASGTVSEVVPADRLLERSLELASTIASWSPVATSNNRRLLDAVVGRSEEDTASLRLESFAPGGDLLTGIERFARRASERTEQRNAGGPAGLRERATSARARWATSGGGAGRAWWAIRDQAADVWRKRLRPARHD